MSSVFDKHYKRYDAWYDKNRFTYLSELEAIKRVLPKKGNGLEIGVGSGRFAGVLGIKCGIDPSRKLLEIAEKRGVNARLGCGEKLPFRNSSFDYIAIIITICFVKDPQKVLKESIRILKKNGKLIIGVINKDSFLGKYYQRKKGIFYKQANFFGIKELTELLKKEGFKKFGYCQTIFGLPNEIDSIQRPQKGFGSGGFVVITAKK